MWTNPKGITAKDVADWLNNNRDKLATTNVDVRAVTKFSEAVYCVQDEYILLKVRNL